MAIEFNSLTIDEQIEVLHLRDALKAARQIAFRCSYKIEPERRELLVLAEETQDAYEGLCKQMGWEPEPVFDERTYVPNPDRWI